MTFIKDIQIDKDFESFLPVSEEHFEKLEQQILTDGHILDSLKVGSYVCADTGEKVIRLIDGHTRYKIAQKHSISFQVAPIIEFESKADVFQWIFDYQVSRRNLNDYQRYEAVTKLREIEAAEGLRRKKKLSNKIIDKSVLFVTNKTDETYHNTREIIAENLGWSSAKLAKADAVMRHADEQTKQRLAKGETTFNREYERIRAEEKQVTAHSKSDTNIQVHYTSDTDQWYTPQHIIDLILEFWGEIDTDPCSNSKEHPNVLANTIYTVEDDGLTKKWTGKTYINPPYGREIGNWTEKSIVEYESNNASEVILLVPARTDTTWFTAFAAYPRCFIKGRLKFSNAENSAPFPSALIYLGSKTKAFANHFASIGDTYQKIN